MSATGYTPSQNSFLVVATVSPDHHTTPPTAAIVQHKLGLPVMQDGWYRNLVGCDLTAACSSFLMALFQGDCMIRSGNIDDGIVCGADVMSTTHGPLDRALSIILADAGFALGLQKTDDPAEDCFLPHGRSFMFGLDGQYADLIRLPAGGSARPITQAMFRRQIRHEFDMVMQGNEVLKIVVKLVREVVGQALVKACLKITDIDLFVFHQANHRIIKSITKSDGEGLGIADRTFNNIQLYGNTTSPAVGLCLADAHNQGKLEEGMRVMLVVFGGGLTWGTCIINRWPEVPVVAFP